MDNIVFSLNVVLPLILIMALGQLIRQLKWISPSEVSAFNNLSFMIFLPCLLFNNVRGSSLTVLDNTPLFTFIIVGTLLSFALATLFVVCIEPVNARRGVMIQGIARSNYSVFGIPLLTLLMPDQDIGVASMLVAVVIPIYNIVSVIVLIYFGSKQANIKSILLGVVKNPLIISTLSGALFLFQGWTLPTALDIAVTDLGQVAVPLSLFLLGASFDFSKLQAVWRQTAITVAGRLLVVPITALTIAALMGFRDLDLACVLIVFSSPTAVSSYTMAEKLGGDSSLASAIMLFTSSCCVISLFLIIWGLKTLQLL